MPKGKGNAGNDSRKSDVTRERILKAARKVFSELPYNAASMRMIGSAGDFDHPLIRYYFRTKDDLFEAVVAEVCEEYYANYITWIEGLDRMPLPDGFALYLDRFLDYNSRHPEAMRLISLNFSMVDEFSDIPGYKHIPEVLQKIRQTFEANIPPRAPAGEIGRFISSFNALTIIYLGASSGQAAILDMDPKSDEYRTWVKETFLYIFLPLLQKLIFPE